MHLSSLSALRLSSSTVYHLSQPILLDAGSLHMVLVNFSLSISAYSKIPLHLVPLRYTCMGNLLCFLLDLKNLHVFRNVHQLAVLVSEKEKGGRRE